MKQPYKRKNYPKKALTAYNIFFKETREKILIEHGKTNFQEMVRKIAALWKEITYAEKVRFEAIAARDLARYKDEVKEYEQRIVEENEANKRQKTMQNSYVHDQTPGSIDLQKLRENPRDTHSMHNPSMLNSTRGNVVAGMGQRMPERPSANPTLTSDELELALRGQMIDQSRLDTVGRRLPNASVSSNMAQRRNSLNSGDVRLSRGNSLNPNFLGADRTNPSGDAAVGDRIGLGLHRLGGIPMSMKNEPKMNIAVGSDHDDFDKRLAFHRGGLSINNGIESVDKYARGVDPMSASNSGKGPMSTFKEDEVRSLVHEAKMRFGSSNAIRPDRDNIVTPPLTASNSAIGPRGDSIRNESELRRRLSLRNQATTGSNEIQMRNQLMLNELNNGVRGPSDEDRMMLQRMMAGDDLRTNEMELRRRLSMENVRNQSMSRNPELQMRLAMMQEQKLVEEKLGNTLEELRRREERVSRREQMINQWVSGTPWSRAFNA